MSTFRLHRRSVLRGLAAGLALPPLEAMMDTRNRLVPRASAATGERSAVRFVCFAFMTGAPNPHAHPTTTGSGFELPLAYEPLTKFREQLTIVTNLGQTFTRWANSPGGDHGDGQAGATTGFPGVDKATAGGAPSYEWVLGNALGSATQIPALSLALPRRSNAQLNNTFDINNGPGSNFSWTAARQKAPLFDTPRKIFDKILPKVPGMTADPAQLTKTRREKSLLDFVRGDATRLSQRLGGADRARLQQHLDSLRDLEKEINGIDVAAAASCGTSPMPQPADAPLEKQPHFDECMRLTAKLLAYAFRCDLTRYALINVNSPELPAGTKRDDDAPDPDHHTGHFDWNDPRHVYFSKKRMEHVAMLAEELAAATEGEHDLLYQSVITTAFGVASGHHSHSNMAHIVLGRGGGQIRSGVHLRMPGPGQSFKNGAYDDGGTPQNNLIATLFNVCGMRIDKFGADGTGLVPELLA